MWCILALTYARPRRRRSPVRYRPRFASRAPRSAQAAFPDPVPVTESSRVRISRNFILHLLSFPLPILIPHLFPSTPPILQFHPACHHVRCTKSLLWRPPDQSLLGFCQRRECLRHFLPCETPAPRQLLHCTTSRRHWLIECDASCRKSPSWALLVELASRCLCSSS